MGLVLFVTGVIALAHNILRVSGRLPAALRNNTESPRAERITAIVLIVAGVLAAVVAARIG